MVPQNAVRAVRRVGIRVAEGVPDAAPFRSHVRHASQRQQPVAGQRLQVGHGFEQHGIVEQRRDPVAAADSRPRLLRDAAVPLDVGAALNDGSQVERLVFVLRIAVQLNEPRRCGRVCLAPGKNHRLVNVRVLGKEDTLRVMRGEDGIDLESGGEETALLRARGIGDRRGREHLGKDAGVGLARLIGERSEERADTRLVDRRGCFRVRGLQRFRDLNLALLQGFPGRRVHLAVTDVVPRERRVHDDQVVGLLEVLFQVVGFALSFCPVQAFARGARFSDGGEQVAFVEGENFEGAGHRLSVDHAVLHRIERHAVVIDRGRPHRQVAGGELDAVAVDVEATQDLLDEGQMDVLRRGVPPRGFDVPVADRVQRRHQQGPRSARRVDDAELLYGFRVAPVARDEADCQAGEQHGRGRAGVERPVVPGAAQQ